MGHSVARERNVVVSRYEDGQEKEDGGKEKNRLERGGVSVEPCVHRHTEDENSYEGHEPEVIEKIKRAMQIGRRDGHSQYLEGPQNGQQRSCFDRHLLDLSWRSSCFCYRSKGVDSHVLPAIVECLPRPINKQHKSLDSCAKEGEHEAGSKDQEDWNVDISDAITLDDSGKLFVRIKEQRGWNMSGAQEKKSCLDGGQTQTFGA